MVTRVRETKKKKAGGRTGNNQAYTRGRGKSKYKHCDNRHENNNNQTRAVT